MKMPRAKPTQLAPLAVQQQQQVAQIGAVQMPVTEIELHCRFGILIQQAGQRIGPVLRSLVWKVKGHPHALLDDPANSTSIASFSPASMSRG